MRWRLFVNGLELISTGVVLALVIAMVTGHGGEYSCAPVDSDDDEGEACPEDPDRWRDYDQAAERGVL